MDWAGLITLLAAGLLVAYMAGVAQCAWRLTHPPRRGYAFAVARSLAGTPMELPPRLGGPLPFREFVVRAGGVELAAWEVTGGRPGGPVAIVTHGWGESRVHGLLRLEPLARAASRVILWDLRGHGESTGVCALGTQEADDLLAVMDVAGDAPAGFVLYGSSLGAGVSIVAAARDGRVRAVIAEAPYRLPGTPAQRVMAQAGMPWRLTLPLAMGLIGLWLGRGSGWFGRRGASEFDRAAWAMRVSCPLLVLHGDADAVCPVEDGRAIAGAAGCGQIVEIARGGHLDLWVDEELRARCGAAVRAHVEHGESACTVVQRAGDGGTSL